MIAANQKPQKQVIDNHLFWKRFNLGFFAFDFITGEEVA
jgi:hypothetical protein